METNIPFLNASDLGKAREHLFTRNGKQCKNCPQDKTNEVFCYAEMMDGNKIHFWMQRTAAMEPLYAKLIQDRKYNQHIRFVELESEVYCTIEDGIYISKTRFYMTKEEFAKFRETIIPYDEIEVRHYGNQ